MWADCLACLSNCLTRSIWVISTANYKSAAADLATTTGCYVITICVG
jgi:hypothetical protein